MRKTTIALFLLVLFSCSKEELPTSGSAPVKEAEVSNLTPEINYQRAVLIAEKAPSMFTDAMTKGANKSILNSEIVSNGVATKSSDSDALMYIFNYAEGGYAVIPTVDINGEVIAYIEEGSFKVSDTLNNDHARFMMNLMINHQKKILAKYANSQMETKGSIPPIVENIPMGPVCSRIDFNDDYGYPVAPPALAGSMGDAYYTTYGCWKPDSNTLFSTIASKSPMLTTTWGQGHPYNMWGPKINGTPALAGSVALAVAQIMLYHSYPIYYPTFTNPNTAKYSGTETKIASLRNYIVATGPGPRDYGSRLLHAIGYLVNNNWGLTRTSAYTSAVPNAFSQMGYPKPIISNYSESAVKQSLIASSPVYIGEITNTSNGCIHAWVIDGYKTVRWTVRRHVDKFDEFGNYNGRIIYNDMIGDNHYYHSNFGFEGASNGYYEAGVFDTTQAYENTGANVDNGDFSSGILNIITGIKK